MPDRPYRASDTVRDLGIADRALWRISKAHDASMERLGMGRVCSCQICMLVVAIFPVLRSVRRPGDETMVAQSRARDESREVSHA